MWATRRSPGQASYASGTFSVTGAGVDIWDASDQFRFVYQTLDGDGEIVARVDSLQNTDALGESRRDDPRGSDRRCPQRAGRRRPPANGMSFQWRATRGGVST